MNQKSSADCVFWAAPLLFGMLAVFGGTLLSAAMLSSGRLGQESTVIVVCIPLIGGCLLTSFWSAKRAPAHRFPLGFLIGMGIPLNLMLLGLTQHSAEFVPSAVGLTVGCAAVTSGIGALIGAASKK